MPLYDFCKVSLNTRRISCTTITNWQLCMTHIIWLMEGGSELSKSGLNCVKLLFMQFYDRNIGKDFSEKCVLIMWVLSVG